MSSGKKRTILISIAVIVLVLPMLCLILFSMGIVSGEEFSPDDFSRRRFHYCQIPGLKWTIMKKDYVDTTSGFEQDLLNSKLITATNNQPKVWHLCSDSTNPRSAECDARLLVNYLDMYGEDHESYWETWNEKYPQLAKIFWPAVADLARHEMYLAIPDLMRLAMSTEKDQPKRFKNKLQQLSGNLYFELGRLDHELKKNERALERLARAIELQPTREAYQLRADIFDAAGNTLAAAKDRETAQQTDASP